MRKKLDIPTLLFWIMLIGVSLRYIPSLLIPNKPVERECGVRTEQGTFSPCSGSTLNPYNTGELLDSNR